MNVTPVLFGFLALFFGGIANAQDLVIYKLRNITQLPVLQEYCINCESTKGGRYGISNFSRFTRSFSWGGKSNEDNDQDAIVLKAYLIDRVVRVPPHGGDLLSPLDTVLNPFEFSGNLAKFNSFLWKISEIDASASNIGNKRIPDIEISLHFKEATTLRNVLLHVCRKYGINITATFNQWFPERAKDEDRKSGMIDGVYVAHVDKALSLFFLKDEDVLPKERPANEPRMKFVFIEKFDNVLE